MSKEPADQLASAIRNLQSKLDSLQSDARLTRLRDEIEDLTTTVSGLGQRVKQLRARGYVFETALQGTAESLAQQWATLRGEVSARIEKEAAALQWDLRTVEAQVKQVVDRAGDPAAAQSLLTKAQAAVETLEGKVKAVQDSIRGMYDNAQSEVNQFVTHLQRVEWMLAQLAEATFQLLPTEAGIMAVSAKWVKGDKDDPRGVLYLTDQRLLFEQKQEIATKKVLFITTQKQKVQQLLFEVPLGQIEKVVASRKGLLGHEDHIELTLAPEAPIPTAHFHLSGQDCNWWQGLIGRAKAGEFDQDRVVPLDQVAVEKAKTAPDRCPNCRAPITQPVLRGMDSIKCQYCGHVIRL